MWQSPFPLHVAPPLSPRPSVARGEVSFAVWRFLHSGRNDKAVAPRYVAIPVPPARRTPPVTSTKRSAWRGLLRGVEISPLRSK